MRVCVCACAFAKTYADMKFKFAKIGSACDFDFEANKWSTQAQARCSHSCIILADRLSIRHNPRTHFSKHTCASAQRRLRCIHSLTNMHLLTALIVVSWSHCSPSASTTTAHAPLTVAASWQSPSGGYDDPLRVKALRVRKCMSSAQSQLQSKS
jgi:hypothetical protein